MNSTYKLNTASLEGSRRAEVLRQVRVVDRYNFDGVQRVSVEILTGPARGRVVCGIGYGNLRHHRSGEFII